MLITVNRLMNRGTGKSVTATLTSTGNGTGVSTLRLEVSQTQTLTLTGSARFYTDAAGTLGESTTWALTTGALRTIYLKAPSGSSVLNIPMPNKVIGIGNTSLFGWESAANAAFLNINIQALSTLVQFRVTGSGSISSNILPASLKGFVIASGFFKFNSSQQMPDLTALRLDGIQINYTGLNIGNGNLTLLNLTDYRIAKMSSPDMVTLLTQLTNRTGSLPNTITINDYADFAAPPASVTNAVAALKAAKTNITTVTLGA